MSSDDEGPPVEWPEPGEHAPDGFVEREPEPGRTTPRGEPVDLVYDPDTGQPDLPDCDYDVTIIVVRTPALYLTELTITPQDNPDGGVEKAYAAGEARQIGSQIKDGDAPRFTEMLGADAAAVVADYLVASGAMCGTLSLGEAAGMDVVEAFQDGRVTAEEFIHEFSRNMDKQIDEK